MGERIKNKPTPAARRSVFLFSPARLYEHAPQATKTWRSSTTTTDSRPQRAVTSSYACRRAPDAHLSTADTDRQPAQAGGRCASTRRDTSAASHCPRPGTLAAQTWRCVAQEPARHTSAAAARADVGARRSASRPGIAL